MDLNKKKLKKPLAPTQDTTVGGSTERKHSPAQDARLSRRPKLCEEGEQDLYFTHTTFRTLLHTYFLSVLY